jgi:hypothetical protein
LARAKATHYRLQLAGVWASRLEARRRPRVGPDPDVPQYDYSPVRDLRLRAEGQGFSCRIQITVRVPVFEDEIFQSRLDMEGHFISLGDTPIGLSAARTFASRQALYLLWPFARGYLDQMGMMAGVGLPPLPLLLVPPSRPFSVDRS